MIKTINQATDFIAKSIKNIDPSGEDLDVMTIRDMVEDAFYDKIADAKLSKEDMKDLTEKIDDEKYVESVLQWKVPNYYTKLEETVKEILTEYMLELNEAS